MSEEVQEKKETITMHIIILVIMTIISFLILTKSYEGIRKRDLDFGLLLMFSSIFFNIAFSFGLKNKVFVKYFFWGTFCFYTLYLFWSTRKDISFEDDSILLLMIIEFFVIIIYTIYYLIRRKKLGNIFKKE
ncbi:hypothetical protein [Aquimarina algiphila]|uniref:hypothetical protein n=1 Tax=Aquimarina algiphila TaxID=2047982 RepID=UPI00249151DC|nr:hypothetical protein [Aquimarina algiphila]